VLNNFLLLSSFFLDGLANAVRAIMRPGLWRARTRPPSPVRRGWSVLWGFAFAFVVAITLALLGPVLIDIMTANEEVRRAAESS